MKFFVWHRGNAAGLPGDRATVDIEVEFYGLEQRSQYVERVCGKLQKAFEELWQTGVTVTPEAEIDASLFRLEPSASIEGESSQLSVDAA